MQSWIIDGYTVTFSDESIYSCDCIFFKRGTEVAAMGPAKVKFRCEHIRKVIIQEAKLRIQQERVTETVKATTFIDCKPVIGKTKRAIKLE